jgi:hypothetical protein
MDVERDNLEVTGLRADFFRQDGIRAREIGNVTICNDGYLDER